MNIDITEVQPFIQYFNTFDDFLAFNEFHCFRSTERKKKRIKQIRIGTAILAFLGFMLGFNVFQTTSLGFWIIPVVTVIVPAIYLFVLQILKNRPNFFFRWMVTRGFAKSRNKDFIGEHRVSLDDNGIVTSSKYSETRFAWGAIDKIESEEGYTYIYMTGISAIIIPHNNITEGDFEAMLKAIKTHYKQDQQLLA